LKIQDLKPSKGARSQRKRKGRGMGSGIGKTSGRGHKGQKARSGSSNAFGFEGGQMPLIRKIPKVGFVSKNKIRFNVVNLEKLNTFKEETHITPSYLKKEGFVKTKKRPVKILGKGELKKKLKVSAHAFSNSAKAAIEKAGGTVEVIAENKKPGAKN